MSRIQCKYFPADKRTIRVEYISDKWYICDGDGRKPSTNGTWIFAETATKIYDGMLFKAGHLLFKAKVQGGK